MSEFTENMSITPKDLEKIAIMHISPSLKAFNSIKKKNSKFRFFMDKVRLFYAYNPDSIIIEKCSDNIAGVLIFTYDEQEFSEFAGPNHLSFYIRVIKTLLLRYGINFKKFYLAAKSLLGKNIHSDYVPDEKQRKAGKIWVLLVLEEYRRQGISLKLLSKCIKRMKENGKNLINVTVKKDNQPAVNAYKKFGFKIIGSCTESSGESYIMQYVIE